MIFALLVGFVERTSLFFLTTLDFFHDPSLLTEPSFVKCYKAAFQSSFMAGAESSPFSDIEVSKMLLGDNGIAMLRAIRFGPVDIETIQALSGLPKMCIEGRIPVLTELDMIKEAPEGFLLKQAGIDFLEAVGNSM